MESSNCEPTQISITKDADPDILSYDIIGIGTPTYFFRPPFIVMDFVKRLNGLKGKSSFVFILHGTHQGICGNWIRRELSKKGTTDIGYFRSYGADYWIGYIKRGTLFSHNSPTTQEQSSAVAFGKTIVERFNDRSGETEKFDPPTPIIYAVEGYSDEIEAEIVNMIKNNI